MMLQVFECATRRVISRRHMNKKRLHVKEASCLMLMPSPFCRRTYKILHLFQHRYFFSFLPVYQSFIIMKFTTVFVVLATVATAVSAMLSGNLNTNAKRFAYGLAPLPPHRRSPTPSYGMCMFYSRTGGYSSTGDKVLPKASLRASITPATADLPYVVSFRRLLLVVTVC